MSYSPALDKTYREKYVEQIMCKEFKAYKNYQNFWPSQFISYF